MKHINKKIIVICSICVVFLLTILLNINLNNYKFTNKEPYDETLIRKHTNTYSYFTKEGVCDEKSGSIDFDFSGVDTLWEIEVNEDLVLNIKYDSKIENGDFKVVLVTESDKIIGFVNGTEKGNKDLQLEKGTNRIKIIGTKAKGKLSINFDDKNLKSRPISFQ